MKTIRFACTHFKSTTRHNNSPVHNLFGHDCATQIRIRCFCSLSLIDELLKFITSGSLAGLPPILVMAIPFIIGLIVGFLVKKFLKIAIIVAIVAIIVSYFGLFSLSLSTLEDLAAKYGPMTIHFAVLLMGMLPLSIGFIIGLIIGFIFG